MPDINPIAPPIPQNFLLAALPAESLARLRPLLTLVDLPLRQILHEPGKPITVIYFPETGWTSVLVLLEDGDSAEVGLIGQEGLVGLPVLLGEEAGELECMVQCPGTAFSLSADAFRAALERDPELKRLLLRHALCQYGQASRTAACNGRHHTEQRLARWLLMAHDRAREDSFPMTHEFLGMMLGVRRAGISVAAGLLQKAGFIRYERGRIEITDRPGLESASCECYDAVRQSQGRLSARPGSAKGS